MVVARKDATSLIVRRESTMKGDYTSRDVRWDPPPPVKVHGAMRLWYPGVGEEIGGWMINQAITQVATHYYKGRTRPCIGKDHGCEPCLVNVPPKWKGFMPVLRAGYSKAFLMEITHNSAVTCPLLLDTSVNLRGMKLRVRRTGTKANSPCVAFVERELFPAKLPAELDARKALCIIWEVPIVEPRSLMLVQEDPPKGGEA
jgi:hypothetical protein